MKADALSRLLCQDSRVAMAREIYAFGAVHKDLPIMTVGIAQVTLKDPLLSKVYQYVLIIAINAQSHSVDAPSSPGLGMEITCVHMGES